MLSEHHTRSLLSMPRQTLVSPNLLKGALLYVYIFFTLHQNCIPAFPAFRSTSTINRIVSSYFDSHHRTMDSAVYFNQARMPFIILIVGQIFAMAHLTRVSITENIFTQSKLFSRPCSSSRLSGFCLTMRSKHLSKCVLHRVDVHAVRASIPQYQRQPLS